MTPCKDCISRYPGCHGHCERYAAFAREREAQRMARRERIDKAMDLEFFKRKAKNKVFPL